MSERFRRAGGAGPCPAGGPVRPATAGEEGGGSRGNHGFLRVDDDMNVLCLGSEVVGAELAADLVRAFLRAEFDGGERYTRRLEKIRRMEMSTHAQDTAPTAR